LEALHPEPRPVASGADLDFVQLFVRDVAELERLAPQAIGSLKPDGLLWICFRKGGRKAGSDLSRDVLWRLMEPRGLVGVTLVAIDDEWSAMRFRPSASKAVSIRD
jgi:hypothetical protein